MAQAVFTAGPGRKIHGEALPAAAEEDPRRAAHLGAPAGMPLFLRREPLSAGGEAAPSGHEGALLAAAESGLCGPAGGLPHLAVIQKSFGSAHEVSRIPAHVGGAAAAACREMGATAYAAGGAVAFREPPDLHTAAHEAAHVVQQRAGVQLEGGVGKAGDTYERNADEVADRVVQGKSAADLLPRAPGLASGRRVQGRGETHVQRTPIAAPRPTSTPHVPPLDTEDKRYLISSISGLIPLSYTAFSNAAARVGDAFNAEAATQAKWAGVILESVLAFAVPGLGGMLTRALSRMAQSIASRARLLRPDGTPFRSSNLPARLLAFSQRTEAFQAATMTTAVEASKAVIESNAVALFGQSETDQFINNLTELYRQSCVELLRPEYLASLSDDELVALDALYCSEAVSEPSFTTMINSVVSDYSQQVLAISDTTWDPLSPDVNLGLLPSQFGGGWAIFERVYVSAFVDMFRPTVAVMDPFLDMALTRSYEEHDGPWGMNHVGAYQQYSTVFAHTASADAAVRRTHPRP